MNETKMKRAKKILAEKLLVSPICAKIEGKKEAKYYVANGLHLLDKDDFYFPECRELRLFMPASVTRKDVKMVEDLPEQIKIKLNGAEKSTFTLSPVSIQRKIKSLTRDDKEVYNKYLTLKEENPESTLNIPVSFYIRLPLEENNKILTNEVTYSKVIDALARDLYKTVHDAYENSIRLKLSTRAKIGFKLSAEQEAQIDDKYFKFINNFDAFEIGRGADRCVIANYVETGLDPNRAYQIYQALLYRIPENTEEEKNIKNKIFGKVVNRKIQLEIKDRREQQSQAQENEQRFDK